MGSVLLEVATVTSSQQMIFQDNIRDFDLFDPSDSVGDILCAAVGLDWASIQEQDDDIEFDCDVTLIRILAKERMGAGSYRVKIQSVYSPEVVVDLVLSPYSPYNITLGDFSVNEPNPSLMKIGKHASRNDILAKREALYDSDVAALALHSPDVLNTRKKAYKKVLLSKPKIF